MPPCLAAAAVNAGRRAHESRNIDDQRLKLREALLNNADKLSRKFKEWDEDGDGGVSKDEFRKAVPQMGIPMMLGIPREDIDDLFDALDVDGSGSISYKELKKLLENKPVIKNPIKRAAIAALELANSTTVQTLLYVAFVAVFQMLTETLRNPKLEYFFDKMFKDTIIDNHFDSSHNTFEDVRRVADIYEWGNYVLWPGLFGNLGPFGDVGRPGVTATSDEVWPDGDYAFHGAGATAYTVPELVENMDFLDWTEGIYARVARVAPTTSEICGTEQLTGECYPEIDTSGKGELATEQFGHNWTAPTQSLAEPFVHWTQEQLGSIPGGQFSAAITSMRMQPTSGYVALAIPFFSLAWLPEQRGACDPAAGQVDWYKSHMLNRSTSATNATYQCVRLSPNGVDCRQLCDPTDVGREEQARTRAGRGTGVVRAAVENWWNDLKRGHWIDQQARVVTITMQTRSNHIGIRYRVTLMFEMTSLGSVLPSYDMETLVEDEGRLGQQWLMMNLAMGMCGFFVVLEGIALVQDGPGEYFGDMWNLMDWLNFIMFFLVWYTLFAIMKMRDDNDAGLPCSELCRTVGYVDAWEVMGTSRTVKVYLSLCVCIQLLKIIKFTNVLIPKMSLMTSVLGKGKTDLAFFGIVFAISMFAFSNLFYVQLGPVMEDFNDQVASFLSLSRALFGDFDIQDIMNNSKGYTNAVFMLIYLFVAVFILLSMFLAILGEAQAAVRADQDDAQETGTAPPEYGVLSVAGEMIEDYRNMYRKRMNAKKKQAAGEEPGVEAGGGTPAAPPRRAGGAAGEEGGEEGGGAKDKDESPLGELKATVDSSLAGIRGAVAALSTQVRAINPSATDVSAAAQAADGVKNMSNMKEVLLRFEAKMNRRLAQLDTNVGDKLRSDAATPWGKVATKVATDDAENKRRRRRTTQATQGRKDQAAAAATMGCGSATGSEGGPDVTGTRTASRTAPASACTC